MGRFAFLSTLSLRRATSDRVLSCDKYEFLSTLSLRRATGEEGKKNDSFSNFYPRSPCGERRRWAGIKLWLWIFLSTLSLRRATTQSYYRRKKTQISIHALLAESDFQNIFSVNLDSVFLSTLSLRRATLARGEPAIIDIISIHALLAESDNLKKQSKGVHHISIHALLAESDAAHPAHTGVRRHFYPRSPCGERPYGSHRRGHGSPISIHALLAESD